MKMTTLIWIKLLVIAAYMLGRQSERMATVHRDVSDLKNRVRELELERIRREERLFWPKRALASVPLLGKLFRH